MEHRPTGHPLESKEQVQGVALLGAQALAACTLYKAGRNAYPTCMPALPAVAEVYRADDVQRRFLRDGRGNRTMAAWQWEHENNRKGKRGRQAAV